VIRPGKIKSNLFGGVGFRQSTLTGYDIVDAANQVSSSGLFYQDASFLITIKNIKATQENPLISDVDFNKLLKQVQESVILDVCNKVTAGESDYLQSVNLYPYEKTFKNTLDVTDKFSGFRIVPNNRNNLISKLSFIELCFDSDVTFNLYLYNSNNPNLYIQTVEVNAKANESTIVDLGWFISDDTTHKGGVFYLGYFEDDLGGAKPIKRDFEMADLGRSTKCFYIEPVKLEHAVSVIDVSTSVEVSDTGGLNLGVEIYNDYTEFISKNKNLFWQAIQTQMAIKVLNLIATSTQSNATQRILQNVIDRAIIELHGTSEGNIRIEGLTVKNERIINDLKKQLFYKPRIQRRTLR
jgi:hypothetical protein